MATKPAMRSIKPPFSWLGKSAHWVALAILIALGGFFRFFRLDSLPPGLGSSVASSALDSLKLLERHQLPGFTASNNYAPLWVWLQALPIKVLGPTTLAVRLWPAVLGTLALVTTWFWLKGWFGQRIAWMGTFFLAVTPWAVTLSRNGNEAAAMPLLLTGLLWLLTIAWRRGGPTSYIGLAGGILVAVLLGPVGWTIVVGLGVLGLGHLLRDRRRFKLTADRLAGLVALAVVLAITGYLFGTGLTSLDELPKVAGFTASLSNLMHNLVDSLLMLAVPGAGDQNYQHNLAGQPMLNIFVSLMLVTGLLVSVSRLENRRYRWLLGLSGLMLLPAVFTNQGVPNAGRAVALLPLVLALAAVGVSYLLELWYATFPINSAARTIGQSAILLLFALTAFQGYTQYFRAWGGSSEVHAAYNEGTVQLAGNLQLDKSAGNHYVVASSDQQAIIAYLAHTGVRYQPLDINGLTALPTGAGPREFYVLPADRDAAVKLMKAKFPGGVFRPHYSLFNQTESYYTYETNQ